MSKNNDITKTYTQKSLVLRKDTQPDDDSVNFPWFVYPNTPFAGYENPIYIPELFRLNNNLTALAKSVLKCKNQILFHLTIGSPMEEAGDDTIKYNKCQFQMHQLVPDHLLRAGEAGIEVINFVVCPNIVDKPMFYTQTDDFKKTNNSVYVHKYLPIKIFFFTTLIPTNDAKRNKKIMVALNERHKDVLVRGVEMYRQTSGDVKFIDEFYKNLLKIIQVVNSEGGACTCFNFAVFNDLTINRRFNNFCMFKEILKIYNHDPKNIVAEWIFRYGTYTLYNFSKNTESYIHTSICFVPYIKLSPFDLTCSFIKPTIVDGKIIITLMSAKNIMDIDDTYLDEKYLMIIRRTTDDPKRYSPKLIDQKEKDVHVPDNHDLDNYEFHRYSDKYLCKCTCNNKIINQDAHKNKPINNSQHLDSNHYYCCKSCCTVA
jgi:hypothetical protein